MTTTKILDNLYVGSCPTTQTDVAKLKELGITAVLNLQTDEDISWRGIERENLIFAYRACRIEEVRHPIRDFDYEDLRRQLPAAVSRLNTLLNQGHRVYVHCTAGMNRSPTVVIAYLYWAKKWDFAATVQLVCQRHPCDPLLEAITEQTAPEWSDDSQSDDAGPHRGD
ncbi:MAG: dual specificity protein phosphatase family protein [Thermogutta sp.]